MATMNRRTVLGAGAALMTAAVAERVSGDTREKPDLRKTAHTRYAANVEIWWKDKPFLDRIGEAARYGFPAIEFWPFKDKDLSAIAELCRELDLEVAQFTAWGFKPGMNDPKYHGQFVDTIGEACQAARKLSCKKMTVVGGDDQPGMTQKQMHEHIITALKKAAPVAEEHDVMMILEPMNIRVDHKGHCLYGSEPAVRICREVDSSHVKINWDLYHMQISEGDLCGRLRDGFDQLGYVQIADHPGRHEPGTGEIHYNRVLKEVHDLGYKGYVGVECWPATTEKAAARALLAADVW